MSPEKATSEYIPGAQEDLAVNLELTDLIKSKSIAPKDAVKLLRDRLLNPNPNVQLLTLQLLDKCVKNGGKHFLVEMAGRDFVDAIVGLLDDEEYGMVRLHLTVCVCVCESIKSRIIFFSLLSHN